jgi:hypothetical protein
MDIDQTQIRVRGSGDSSPASTAVRPSRRPAACVAGRFHFQRTAVRFAKELLSLKLDPSTSCAEVKDRAEAKIADIEARIESLKRMKRALVNVTKACSGRGGTSDWPILEALDGQTEE